MFEYLITDDRSGHGARSGRANGASDRRHQRSRLEASASRTAATVLCKVVKSWISWFSLSCTAVAATEEHQACQPNHRENAAIFRRRPLTRSTHLVSLRQKLP